MLQNNHDFRTTLIRYIGIEAMLMSLTQTFGRPVLELDDDNTTTAVAPNCRLLPAKLQLVVGQLSASIAVQCQQPSNGQQVEYLDGH